MNKKKTLYPYKDYEFSSSEDSDISKTGGIVVLRGKGKYKGYMNVKVSVKNGTIKIAIYQDAVVSQKNFKNGKCTVQLKYPKIYSIAKASMSSLKYQFRIKSGDSKKISVSSTGKVTIKSNKKATYVAECLISANHYNTCKRAIKIVVQ